MFVRLVSPSGFVRVVLLMT